MFEFLDNYIKSGYISEGKIDLNLDINSPSIKTLTAENLSGKLSIYDLKYKYEKDFPPLKNVEMEVLLSGANTKILLKQAYSGKILISDGIITLLDWHR